MAPPILGVSHMWMWCIECVRLGCACTTPYHTTGTWDQRCIHIDTFYGDLKVANVSKWSLW